jgi:hypothetical protein
MEMEKNEMSLPGYQNQTGKNIWDTKLVGERIDFIPISTPAPSNKNKRRRDGGSPGDDDDDDRDDNDHFNGGHDKSNAVPQMEHPIRDKRRREMRATGPTSPSPDLKESDEFTKKLERLLYGETIDLPVGDTSLSRILRKVPRMDL